MIIFVLRRSETEMGRIEKTVFISYRRTDEAWGLAVFQDLTQHGYDVFIDYDGIASGNFETVILENIRARAHFLVLLTPTALERCSDPKDWMRREIEAALDSQRNIVPLLLAGFNFGTPTILSQLTGKLATLKQYNGLQIPQGYFSPAMERLRSKFLNVQIDAVLHTASDSAQQVAKEQKNKATMVLGGERPKKAPESQDASTSELSISMAGVSAVDEQAIDFMFNKFGTEWPQLSIGWPQSYNTLISIIRDAVDRFDHEASEFSQDDFIKDAPPALAKALDERKKMQDRLPRLVQRASNFEKRNTKLAVKWYLLWGGFVTHRHLIHISTWRGMRHLKLEVPPAVASLGTSIYHTEDSYKRIFREESEIHHGRLHFIGDYKIEWRGLPYVYLYAPKHMLEHYGIEISDPSEICTWLIPQIELECDDSHLPTKYMGSWKFLVVKDRAGEITRSSRFDL